MASCLVPDFPAVMAALEHLKELDKQLEEERVPFAPEASLHLTEMTAAITELEKDRRAAHEHLEVETIENSKLRHRINNIRERMSREIMADVAAARAANAEEIEKLRRELNTVCQGLEDTVKRHEELSSQNQTLLPHRDQGKAEHSEIIASLNHQISLKYDLQMQLGQTQERIQEVKSSIAAVERDKVALERNMVLEREAVAVEKKCLSVEMNETGEKIKQQKQAIRRIQRELDKVNSKKQGSHGRLEELTTHVTKLESNLHQLTASRCKFEKQLQEVIRKHQELRQQRERLKKDFHELGEGFRLVIQRLKEETAAVEMNIEEGHASRLLSQDRLDHISEIFKRQHEEENEVRAENVHVSQQLEQSTRQLEERIASIVKHRKEVTEMDKQIGELLEAETINRRLFEKDQEELNVNVDTEKKNICRLEEEMSRLKRLLQEAKRAQEEHVAKMTSDINSTKRRYKELQQEGAALMQRQPRTADPDLLMNHMTQSAAEYRQIEIRHRQEIEHCTAEMEAIIRSKEEKQRELKETEEMLKEVEDKWNEEQSRHQRLERINSELRQRRVDLELSIQELKERTSSLLQPKQEMKAELEEMRASYMDVLDKQASELRAVEISIYDYCVKLEQVSMENSRLHLCIRQMTDDLSSAKRETDRYWHATQLLSQDRQALLERLQQAWREDVLVTEDGQGSDGVLLVGLSSLLSRMKTRIRQLGKVNTLLHQQMLAISRRLGDKTTTDQHS